MINNVRCTCCGATYTCTPTSAPSGGFAGGLTGGLGLGALFGGGFGGLAAQQGGLSQQQAFGRSIFEDQILTNQAFARSHSVAARTDVWVVHPNEDDEVRAYRRQEWRDGGVHWHVGYKR